VRLHLGLEDDIVSGDTEVYVALADEGGDVGGGQEDTGGRLDRGVCQSRTREDGCKTVKGLTERWAGFLQDTHLDDGDVGTECRHLEGVRSAKVLGGGGMLGEANLRGAPGTSRIIFLSHVLASNQLNDSIQHTLLGHRKE
jgi:hypothetical protein